MSHPTQIHVLDKELHSQSNYDRPTQFNLKDSLQQRRWTTKDESAAMTTRRWSKAASVGDPAGKNMERLVGGGAGRAADTFGRPAEGHGPCPLWLFNMQRWDLVRFSF